jgi:DNA-binding CsgD family transcriptional regulator/tetratricopeptide (TPR) repeat protein/DNA-binding XRE family transcriptional regulator
LTQEELADRSGLSARGISDLERGLKLRPRKETCDLLASALGLSTAERGQLDAARRRHAPTSSVQSAAGGPLAAAKSLGQPASPARSSSGGASFGHPFICPVLIGRDREVEQLQTALRSAASGGRGIVLLIGEPGIGKSRLLSEFLSTSDAAAFAHLRVVGREIEQDEPFALVRQLAELAGGGGENLLRGSAEASRSLRRTGQALAAALARSAAGRPLILAAEDVHWSDQSSLDVLLAVVERLDQVVLIATLRPEPLSRGLAAFLAEANRLRLSREITLRPLSRGEVARVIYLILNRSEPVPGPLLDEVMAATDGNPFLIEEVFRSLHEAGEIERVGETWRRRPGAALSIPRSLRHAVEARLLAVSPRAAQVAGLAAALGQQVDVLLLQRLSDLDEDALLAALRELRDAQVLTSSEGVAGAAGLGFRHALMREAVLDRLMLPERQHLHRRVAVLLEKDADASTALLAYHWSRAGDLRSAAPYAVRAARGAAALHAHREAIRYYELVLAAEPAPNQEILIALGDHHAALGERDLALARYDEARNVGHPGVAATREPELALRMGICEARERRRNAALTLLQAAWSDLPAGHADRWRAGLWLGLQHGAQGDYARGLAILEAASHAARAAGPIARLRIAYEIGGIRAVTGDWAALEQVGTRVLREAAGYSEDALTLRLDAHLALGTVAYYRAAYQRALDHFQASRILADQCGQSGNRAVADWNVAGNVLAPLGRWTEARAALNELTATAIPYLATLSRWYGLWLAGRWEDAAAQAVANLHECIRDCDVEVLVGFGMRTFDILLALGRAEETLALVQAVLPRVPLPEAAGYAVRLLPYRAEAMVGLEDPRAGSAIDEGLELARRLGAPREEALLLRSRARAQGNLGDWSEAFTDSATALTIFQELGMRYEAARTLRQEALLRLRRGRRGDRDHAASALHSARTWFDEVGAPRDVADVDQILAGAGLTSNRASSSLPGLERLSEREREVAAAIAEGLTNPAIAARLYLSERTVAHHVSAILNKLGLDSRSQVAAHVARATTSSHPRSHAV